MNLTSEHNYFEDFKVGQKIRHRRGKTISGHGNAYFTHTTMNTGEAHFNKHLMLTYLGGKFPERRVNGGYTLSLIVGMTTQDMAENAIAELGYGKITSHRGVHPGHTLYARSEVLALVDSPERDDAGILRYRFEGYNQDDELVLEGERTVLVKKRAHFAKVAATGE